MQDPFGQTNAPPPAPPTRPTTTHFDPFASNTNQTLQNEGNSNGYENAITVAPSQNSQWAIDSHNVPPNPSLNHPVSVSQPNYGGFETSSYVNMQVPINYQQPGYPSNTMTPFDTFPPPPNQTTQPNVSDALDFIAPPPNQTTQPNVSDALDFIAAEQTQTTDALSFIELEQENQKIIDNSHSTNTAPSHELVPAPASELVPAPSSKLVPAPASELTPVPAPAPPARESSRRTASTAHTIPPQRRIVSTPDQSDANIEARKEKIARALAQNAPPDASALPKSSLVGSSGFILTRISFRTLLLKKWKQSYWCKYGPTTILLFRSKAAFDDWKNNPYHNQKERDFLIRMKIDFYGDLASIAGCRGYKITSVKKKAYGRRECDLLMHFKLERHMDYGATIAACFGSQTAEEVENLRRAIVECIRNARNAGGGIVTTTQGGFTNSYTHGREDYDSDNNPSSQNQFRGRYNNDQLYNSQH